MFSQRLRDLLLTAAAPVLWGTTYYVTNAWLPSGYPLFIALLRALPIGLLLCLITRELPQGQWWWRSAVLGFLNIGLFFALLFVAATRLPGGVAATVGAIQPLLVIFMVWVILNERPALRSIGFGVMGLGGVALLVLTPAARLDLLGVAAMVGATLSMAAGTVIGKKWGRPGPLLSFTAWQLVAGGLLLLPVALLAEGVPPAIGAPQVIGLVYMGVINTGLAYVLWFRGLKRLPATTLPMLGLLTPVVALLLGFLLLGQPLGPAQLFGAGLILGSVALSQRRPRPARPAPPTSAASAAR